MASRITEAPVAGALRAASVAELLRAAGDLSEEVACAEVDAWVDAHGDRAAEELCDALRTADETRRGLGFRALLRIGGPAANAVGSLRDDADLVDFVTVFRVDTLSASPDEMDRSGDPVGWVRLLHTVTELWGQAAAAAAWAVPAAGTPGIDKMLDDLESEELIRRLVGLQTAAPAPGSPCDRAVRSLSVQAGRRFAWRSSSMT